MSKHKFSLVFGRRDTQPDNTRQNDTQHNNENATLSIMTLIVCHYDDCRLCRVWNFLFLCRVPLCQALLRSVISLIVVMFSVIMKVPLC
jgi:hypothetical protein